MATTFKTFLSNDQATTRTMLHEAVPVTGTIVSGTYDSTGTPENVKNYSHGMFQSVYDYPYLSSSANHILDITMGYSSTSFLSSSKSGYEGSTLDQQKKKINIYNEMAQVLVGYDTAGNIQEFDIDGDILAGGGKIEQAIFVNFARLLTKDEIKKGSFSMSFMTGCTGLTPAALSGNILTIGDTNAQNSYKVNSPAGEYALLKVSDCVTDHGHVVGDTIGHVYYQAGIAVLSSSVFAASQFFANQGKDRGKNLSSFAPNTNAASGTVFDTMLSSSIQLNADAFRRRLNNLSFNNTTELNSTIYFCRANNTDFNYSTNPTYTNASKIVVKNNTFDNPVSYITTVGLYSADNELLAVAKLSEPIKKDPTNELTFRVRLDY
jgi:hypothetical protein